MIKLTVKWRVILIVLVGMLILVAGLLLATRHSISSQPMAVVSPVALPNDLAIAQSYKDASQVYLSNGRDIVRYNLTKQTATVALKSGQLPTIKNLAVSPDDQYLVFQSTNGTPTDSLAALSKTYSLSTDQPHWWFANLTTGKITPLPNNFSRVFWSHDPQKFYGIENSPTSALYSYNVGDLTQTVVLQADQLLWARELSDGYLIERSDVLIKTSKKFNNPTKLLSSLIGAIYAAPDNNTLITETKPDKQPQVVALDQATGKTRVLFKNQTLAAAAFSQDGSTAFVSLDDGSIYSYSIAQHSLKKLVFGKSAVSGKARVAFTNDGVLVATSSGLSIVSGDSSTANLDSVSKLSAYNSGTPDYAKNPAYWTYFDPSSSKTTVTILAAPLSSSLDSALAAIKGKGIDPNTVYVERSVPTYLQGAR